MSGKLQYKEFIVIINENIIKYLNEIYQNKYQKGLIEKEDYINFPNFKSLYDWCISCGGRFFTKATLYDEVYNLMVFINPSIERYLKYDEDHDLATECIPDYLDAEEASVYIDEEIFSKIPSDLSKSQKKKYIMNECKRLFHIENNKYPHWVQSSEWPVRNNKPLKYIKRIKKDDLVIIVFEDVDTKEQVFIEQFY